MELEFASASRRLKKEQDARKRAMQKQKMQEAKAKMEADKAAERVRQLAEQKRLERQRAQEEEESRRRQNQGIEWEADLKAVPFVKIDTNRVILPKSALESLERQRALDIISGPLTFELIVDGNRTHCGVDEFTAEEGTLAIPPQVALSLAKENGVDWLVGKSIHVRFVQLNRQEKISVTFQPRGDGFHIGDKDVVNIDIKSVLMRTLRDVLTLTEGDWIPVRHDGTTYELIVRKMTPEPAMTIINTDVEVELMQAENVEKRELKQKQQKEWLENRLQALEQKKPHVLARVAAETNAQATRIRVRLPNGQTHMAKFSMEGPLQEVLDWVEVLLIPVPLPEPMVEAQNDEFQLIGHGKRVFDISKRDESLKDAGISASGESFMVNWKSNDSNDVIDELEEDNNVDESDVEMVEAFSAAKTQAEQKLDRELEESQLRRALDQSMKDAPEQLQVDKVKVFQALTTSGIDPQKAANIAQKFAPQIVELETMGFVDHERNIELLEKYQGRLPRVINLLLGA